MVAEYSMITLAAGSGHGDHCDLVYLPRLFRFQVLPWTWPWRIVTTLIGIGILAISSHFSII
jgi:hypothetical protein